MATKGNEENGFKDTSVGVGSYVQPISPGVEAAKQSIAATKNKRAIFAEYNGSSESNNFKDRIEVGNKHGHYSSTKSGSTLVRIPTDIITFISLTVSLNELKSRIIKRFPSVKDVSQVGNVLYAEIPYISSGKDSSCKILMSSLRTDDELLSMDVVPRELIPYLGAIHEKEILSLLKIKGNKILIKLDNSATLGEVFIRSILNNVRTRSFNLSAIKFSSVPGQEADVNFAIEFNVVNEEIGMVKSIGDLLIDSKYITCANISMTHERYTELANESIRALRSNAKIEFVAASGITRGNSRDLVSFVGGGPIVQCPIILMTDEGISDESNNKIFASTLATDPKLVLFGIDPTPVLNKKLVKEIFGDLMGPTVEPIIYVNRGSKDIYLCPNMKLMTLFTLFESTTGFKIDLTSSTGFIGITLVPEL